MSLFLIPKDQINFSQKFQYLEVSFDHHLKRWFVSFYITSPKISPSKGSAQGSEKKNSANHPKTFCLCVEERKDKLSPCIKGWIFPLYRRSNFSPTDGQTVSSYRRENLLPVPKNKTFPRTYSKFSPLWRANCNSTASNTRGYILSPYVLTKNHVFFRYPWTKFSSRTEPVSKGKFCSRMEGQTGPFEMYKGNFPSRSQKGQFSFHLQGKLTALKKEGFPFGRTYNNTKANPPPYWQKMSKGEGLS